jgi:G:T-mismatch repair DNA endonuclease (very short patch repair protein)
MADKHTKEIRSYNMSRIKSRNTKPGMLIEDLNKSMETLSRKAGVLLIFSPAILLLLHHLQADQAPVQFVN